MSRIAAQDEAVYAREAIEMAKNGNWLTPTYLGRYALNKPPLLQILAAASVKVFGPSAWSVRLPSLTAAAGVVALIFFMVWRVHSLAPAAAAALLLTSNHLFYDFSRLCMTDMLLTFWIAAPMVLLMRDPLLERRTSFWGFAACTGAAIMTKAAAGLVPLIALAIYAAFAQKAGRPSWARVMAVAAAAAAIALPWHLYQLMVHPRWFVAEYILQQHLSIGVTAPPQYSTENHLVFYLRRMFLMDPVLSIATVAAIPVALRRWRENKVVLAWLVILVAALFGFRYRSAYYLLPALPVFAALAAEAVAALPKLGRAPVLAVLVACAVVKTVTAAPVWGIPAGVPTQRSVAPVLEQYCDRHRTNDLIFVGAEDEFFASDLPLARLRYCFVGARATASKRRPLFDFDWLGISVSAAEFNRLDSLRSVFRSRLAEFNLHSDAPLATVIRADTPRDVAGLIEAHPDADFWLPAAMLRGLDVSVPHQVAPDNSGGVFLLARKTSVRQPDRACRL